jgi:hypothetical protein
MADLAAQLRSVEDEISAHRALYLRATWAGHDGEAQHHEAEVDRLIDFWQHVRDGKPLLVT